MVRESEIREGEQAVEMPRTDNAGLVFIGRIRTPWTSRLEAPRQGRHDGPVCRLEIFEPWVPALKGVDLYEKLEVIYWLHLSRRDLVLQSPKNNKSTRGTFSLRSPVRPNPLGTSIVRLVGIEGATVLVRGLDCLDETPLVDLKTRPLRLYPAGAAASGGFRDGVGYCHSGAMRKHRARNLEIPRCAIAHLRSGATAPSRNDGNHAPFNAALSFAALSSSTLPSSLRLAGGSKATPSWRGITCMWR